MGFAEKTFYLAVCDGCGIEDENDEYAAWSDKDGAYESAVASDWRQQDDGRLLCRDCRWKPGGDFYEDDQEVCDPVVTPQHTEAVDD